MKRAARATLAVAALLALGGDEPIPRFPPKSSSEAPATFRTLDGFRMDLLAAEPLVADPVAAAYDEDGRLYVAEMLDYPYVDPRHDRPFAENTEDPAIGRVRLLIDRDGDGRFDESHPFAEGLSWPAGLAVWRGGVFVAATPDLWYLKDTDGDFKADVREKVYTGFRKFNVQAVMNNLQWGPDHRIYGAGSGNGGQVRPADRPGSKPVPLLRQDFRFDPATRRIEAISGGARFGNTFDDWGNRFLCDIRNPAQHVVLPANYLARNPNLPTPRALHDAAEAGDAIPIHRISPPEPWREIRARRWASVGKAYPRSELVGAGFITSSSGVTVYRGDAYPPRHRGQIFLGEVANNVIHREAVGPDGVTFRARRADPESEFVASTDTWFRPVNFVNAPDGTLHVLDMYRESIEHPWSIPDDIKAQLDLRSGSDRGRIYRLAPPVFRPRPTPSLGRATTAELVALLEHPNAWHRDTAHRLLFERRDPAAVGPLRRLLRSSREPLARLHVLWSLEGLDALEDDDLATALDDPHPGVREHAVRLAEPRLRNVGTLRDRILALADDPEIRVRFRVAFSLGELDGPSALAGLTSIARRDAGDEWVRAAVLSSAANRAGPLFRRLIAEGDLSSRPQGRAFLRTLALLVGAEGPPAESGRALDALADSPLAGATDHDALIEIADGLADGLRRGDRSLFDLPTGRAGAGLLEALARSAESIAARDDAPEEARGRAIALIGQRPFAQSNETLAGLLDARQPGRVQLAAARALARYREPGVVPALVRPWASYPPAVRREVLQLLSGRPAWHAPLLDAIEAGTIPAAELPLTGRSSLLDSPDPEARARVRRLLADGPPGSRKDVLARYREALERPGRRDEGEKVFERECLGCHRLGERGHAVGPNLASVRRRSAEEVLEQILDPNREVAPDFLEYAVALADGRTVSGLIAAETAAGLTLRRAEGVEETVLRRDVESIVGSGRSVMPEGFESRITPREMADLLAFLLDIQR